MSNYHLEVNGTPVCESRIVSEACMEIVAVWKAGEELPGFTPRCGYPDEPSVILAAVELRAVIGTGPVITINPSECPVSARETAYDNARRN